MDLIPQLSRTDDPPSAQAEHHLRLLVDVGLQLAGERKVDVIADCGLDAALHLTGATCGVFLFHEPGEDGESFHRFKLLGLDQHALSLPRIQQLFVPGEQVDGVFLADDITADPRFSHDFDSLGLRSYLSAPVYSRSRDLLGRLLCGHAEPGAFAEDLPPMLATLAAQIACALDTARLAANVTHEIALADHARRQQRETADSLRQALAAAQLGTWSWDRNTGSLDLDERAAALLQLPPHLSQPRVELRKRLTHVENLDLNLSPAHLERRLQHGESLSGEFRLDLGDNQPHWIAVHANGAFPSGGSVEDEPMSGIVGTVQDITARKTHEATLRQTEKLAATGRLAATIAHEINNPLEAVTNLIYLAKTDPQVPPVIQSLLEMADSELARVAQIAQQTLGFYRDTTRPTWIDLNALLTGVASLFDRKLQYKKLSCTLDLEPGLRLFSLQGEIRQVFSNLFVNAIDASNQGVITLRARQRTVHGRQGIVVLLSDQGGGVPAALQERLFSPFFTTKASTGTGLGLWVTRGIVEKAGGSISFRTRSTAPSGTVFRVFLPTEPLNSAIVSSPKLDILQ